MAYRFHNEENSKLLRETIRQVVQICSGLRGKLTLAKSFSLGFQKAKQRETSENGLLRRPAHISLRPRPNPFRSFKPLTLFPLSLRFRSSQQPTTLPRSRPGPLPNPQAFWVGLLAPQRHLSQLEQPPAQGDHPPRRLRLRALAHRPRVQRP